MAESITGKTPQRAVRVPDPLWEQAKQAADQRGENVTRVINRALVRYVRDTERRQAAMEEFDRGRASLGPDAPTEDEALRIAAEEKAAMRAGHNRAQAS